MSNFASLRHSQSTASLQKALSNTKKFQRDDRYWKLTTDQQGNGFAVIRFIPAPECDGEGADPFILIYKHSFKGPTGQFYIERSLTTLGRPDPVNELNNRLWATGTKENQDQVRSQKRKTTYVSNIVVVNDPAHPENNGKTFLFEYGKKIMEKIQDKNNGAAPSELSDPSDVKFNPFHLWEGANFKLRATKQQNFPNYDKSEFLAQGPLFADDAKMEAAWNAGYSLKVEAAPEKYKSYEELKNRLDIVLGLAGGSDGEAEVPQTQAPRSLVAPTPKSHKGPSQEEVSAAVSPSTSTEEDDDDFSDWQTLANQK